MFIYQIKEHLANLAVKLNEDHSVMEYDTLSEVWATLSSFTFVRLVIEVEVFFGIEFEDEKLVKERFSDLDQFVEYIQQLMSKS